VVSPVRVRVSRLLFYSGLQVKRREKNEGPTLAGASRQLPLRQGILHGPCGPGGHAWHHVTVDVECDGNGGAPFHLLVDASPLVSQYHRMEANGERG
jgi:hypothetical protein